MRLEHHCTSTLRLRSLYPCVIGNLPTNWPAFIGKAILLRPFSFARMQQAWGRMGMGSGLMQRNLALELRV